MIISAFIQIYLIAGFILFVLAYVKKEGWKENIFLQLLILIGFLIAWFPVVAYIWFKQETFDEVRNQNN